MEKYKDSFVFYAENQAAWREWLQTNHETAENIWLQIFKKESGVSTIYYPEAVDEALCFGWIDSVKYTKDKDSYLQFFTPRKPKSNWSRVNKEKVERLMTANQMQPAGLKMVDLAKQNGCWNASDAVENLEIPADLEAEFQKYEQAAYFFKQFSRSTQKGLLEWIRSAKTAPTRQRRIAETAQWAAINKKVNPYIKK